jgi:flagellar biosynthetic protein FliQ
MPSTMTGPVQHALREALLLVVVCAAPPVLAILIAGVLGALLQTATQVREATISTVPKLIAALVALAVAGPWIGGQVMRFMSAVLEAVPTLGRAIGQ